MGVGCYNSGWNLNWMLLSTTVLPLVLCGALAAKKKKDAAIAVTFLVLPTVTTTIFKIFPCDKLDNKEEYLHADYSLSCDGSHAVWVAYGVAMVLVWPIGVLSLYVPALTSPAVGGVRGVSHRQPPRLPASPTEDPSHPSLTLTQVRYAALQEPGQDQAGGGGAREGRGAHAVRVLVGALQALLLVV